MNVCLQNPFLLANLGVLNRVRLVIFFVAFCLIAQPTLADGLPPQALRIPAEGKVIKLTLPLDGRKITGKLVSYTTQLFTLETPAGETHRVLWNMIPAENADRYWRHLESPEGDAAKLLELGALLLSHSQGGELAASAFSEATEADPAVKAAIKEIKAQRRADPSPRYVGNADKSRWGGLSAKVMVQGVEELRAFSKKAEQQLGIGLKLYESERFMLLTDTDPENIAELAKVLAGAYRQIASLLEEDPDGNLFVGKLLVVLFDRRVDYVRFQHAMHQTDARGTEGMCHGFGNGHAHIALIERATLKQTAHVLIHELTHAFLHRYHGPGVLPDWVNEGLAEHLAHTLQPPPGSSLMLKSRLALDGKRGLGEGFFESENLAAWQYDIAGALTGYLINRGKHVYPAFVRSLKDGALPEEALKEHYRMTPSKLTQRFKQRLDRELYKKLGGQRSE